MRRNMEPLSSSSSSSAAAKYSKKRKRIRTAVHEEAKRLKTEHEGDEELLCEHPSGPPRVSVLPNHLQEPITLKELLELLHYATLGEKRSIGQPSWCHLRHQKKVHAVNVAIVDGLTQSDFYKYHLQLQHLRTTYSTRVTFTPSSDNIVTGILNTEVPHLDCVAVSTPDTELENFLNTHPVVTTFGKKKRGVTAYILSQEEMIRRRYPVKGMVGFEEFVCTDSSATVTDLSPLFGLDCEMCLTEKGCELARVSLVDTGGTCLLDQLVKPPNRILNYLTKFSGITAKMLRPITTTLRDVQVKLRELLPSDAILVGHSINNDLIALKLIHPHVIDTALLYKREFGQRFKLKVLAEVVLNRQIQTEETTGHNPAEDALAALDLAQYFISTEPRKVVELHLDKLWGYQRRTQPPDCKPAPSYRFAEVLQTLGRSVAYLGKRSDFLMNLSNQQWIQSDKELLATFQRQTKPPFLSVLQFSPFSEHLGRRWMDRQPQYRSVCADLRDMCVVFAGPFPAGFSEKEARRVFGRCGPVKRVTMLDRTRFSLQVHAKVEFELLEGATLAVGTLNGLSVQGRIIKVQRPVHESMLDLDVALDALAANRLTNSHLYVLKLKASKAKCINIPPKVNGHTLDGECPDVTVVKSNGFAAAGTRWEHSTLSSGRSRLSEEALRETFSHFGAVEDVVLLAPPGKQAKQAYIKFESSEGKHAALSSSEDLQRENFLICPALTPLHLPSWVAMTTTEDEETSRTSSSSQDEGVMRALRKLDRRLARLFRSLAAGTLSLVLLLGRSSATGPHPGLCLMEVKQECRGEEACMKCDPVSTQHD